MRIDWVGIIEAAYRVTPSREEWLHGVMDAARPALDRGLGIIGYCFEPGDSAVPRIAPVLFRDVHPDYAAALDRMKSVASQDYARRAHRPACATVSQLLQDLPGDLELFRSAAEPMGFRDVMGITAADPTGAGCHLSAPLPRVGQASRREATDWARVAAHLAAGLRLQRLVDARREPDPFADAEAILDARGRLAHAAAPAQVRPARAALREAAVSLTRACGTLRRRDPAEALAVWHALVAGRWSLVDHFDHDDRRFLIARRNDPQTRAVGDLSLRERQVAGYACLGHANKLIAYELGLSPTTVATHLARAALKLGARSRVELIERLRALAAAARPANGSPVPDARRAR